MSHIRNCVATAAVLSGLAFMACAPAAPPPSPATVVVGTAQAVVSAIPTVQAAATGVASTVAVAQTQTAPTVSAAQTQIAPTAAAISTQAAGTVQPVVATAVAGSPVQISQVQVSQADTTIAIRNSGTRQISIGGWILFMGTFPFVLPTNSNMRIDPGQTLTLHFSSGTDTPTDVYVGTAPGTLLNNLQNGATLALVDLQGQLASVYRIP